MGYQITTKGPSKLKLSSENWCKSLLEVKEHPGPTGGVSDVVSQ